MSSAVNVFVHVIFKHSQKCLAQKVASFGPIIMIQPPFNNEPRTKFIHQAVPKLHAVEYWCKNYISTHESVIDIYNDNIIALVNMQRYVNVKLS